MSKERERNEGLYDGPRVVQVVSMVNAANDMTIYTMKKPSTSNLAGKKFVRILDDKGDVFYINPDSQAAIVVYKKSNFDKLRNAMMQNVRERSGQQQKPPPPKPEDLDERRWQRDRDKVRHEMGGDFDE